MKKALTIAASIGAAGLLLTGCGTSAEEITSVPAIEATATAIPGETTPAVEPSETAPAPDATQVNPFSEDNATVITVKKGETFTIKYEGDLKAGQGLSIVSDSGLIVEPTDEPVNFEKKTAEYKALKAGTVRLAIGPAQGGEATGQWTTYNVTVS